MNISDAKIQAALDKLSKRRKESFSENIIASLVNTHHLENPIEKLKAIVGLRDSFISLAEKSKDDSVEVYDATLESLSTAINEHFEILASQMKDALSKI